MRTHRLALVAFALAFVSVGSYAQTAVTATCKDGSTFSGASRSRRVRAPWRRAGIRGGGYCGPGHGGRRCRHRRNCEPAGTQ